MATVTVPETKAGGDLKLEIRRVIRASRQRIFEAWTRPEQIMQWFGPKEATVLDVQTDVRTGGRWRIDTSLCGSEENGGEARRGGAGGEYVEIVPDRLLRFTWLPDWAPEENTLVTVELKDVEDGTEVTLRHERFTSEVARSRHEYGWTGTMEKLAAYLGD